MLVSDVIAYCKSFHNAAVRRARLAAASAPTKVRLERSALLFFKHCMLSRAANDQLCLQLYCSLARMEQPAEKRLQVNSAKALANPKPNLG